MITFSDDDPFFSEISNLIDIIEDIEEDPEAAQILSTYEGQYHFCLESLRFDELRIMTDAVRTYEFTWAIRLATERSRAAKLQATKVTA